MKKIKFEFTESLAVRGRVDNIRPLLAGLKGVKITDSGMDSYDLNEPVVEISFDSLVISDLEIFKAVNDLEKGIGGLANSVGKSFKERG